MNIQPQSPNIDLKRFIFFGDPPMPQMPRNLREVDRLKAMNSYKDDPKLSPEENQKRKEHYAKLEESIKNKKEYSKSAKQREADKKKAKLAAKSKKKNRK
jgi:hypothetical protein